MHRDGAIGNTSHSECEDSRFETWSLCSRRQHVRGWAKRVSRLALTQQSGGSRPPPRTTLAWPSSEGTRLQPATHRGCKSLRQLHCRGSSGVERQVETLCAAVRFGPSAPRPSSSARKSSSFTSRRFAGSTPASGTKRLLLPCRSTVGRPVVTRYMGVRVLPRQPARSSSAG